MGIRSASSTPRAWRNFLRNLAASVLAAFAIAVALSSLPARARAAESAPDSAASALWFGATFNLVSPSGSFDPPGDTPQLGFGAHLSIQPAHSKLGLRLEFGMASGSATTDSVVVEFLPGFSSYEPVTAGNDLWWFMAGAQWDPRPRQTSVYAFTSLGFEMISPKGKAGAGTTVNYEVPGLPASSTVFAYSAGAGARLLLTKKLALCAEAEYVKGGAADYVGAPGVEGSSPTHFATRNAAIDCFAVRLGFSRLH